MVPPRGARGRGLLPAGLTGRAALPLTAAALVAYHRGPVGPYAELLASPVVLADGAGHVPFIAVDSPASVAGGRANWALPKDLAGFDGAPGAPAASR